MSMLHCLFCRLKLVLTENVVCLCHVSQWNFGTDVGRITPERWLATSHTVECTGSSQFVIRSSVKQWWYNWAVAIRHTMHSSLASIHHGLLHRSSPYTAASRSSFSCRKFIRIVPTDFSTIHTWTWIWRGAYWLEATFPSWSYQISADMVSSKFTICDKTSWRGCWSWKWVAIWL